MSTQTVTRRRYVRDHQTGALFAAIAADPFAAMTVGIEAPGGYGKTAALDELAGIYRRAGVEVLGAAELPVGSELPGGMELPVGTAIGGAAIGGVAIDDAAIGAVAFVVDDAHQLSEGQLARLCRIAESPRARLAVGYRPWPRSAALARLAAALRRHRPTLLLAPLTAEQIAELLAARLADRAALANRAGLVESLRVETGGVPGYVERLADVADGAWLAGALAAGALAAGAPSGRAPSGGGASIGGASADGASVGSASGAGASAGNASRGSASVGGVSVGGVSVGGAAGVTVPGVGELPGSVLLRFRQDFDRLNPDCQVFLLAAEAGVAPDLGLLGPLTQRGPEEVAEVVEAVRATGLLGHDGTLVPVARRAVAALFPVDRRVAVRRRLAEVQLRRGASVLGLARALLGTGVTGPEVATMFEAAADEALSDDPALSAALFGAGAAAGRPVRALAARWAHAAALSGDLGSALRMADGVIAGPRRPEQAECAVVAAAALAHRGQLARSAELYRWAGTGTSAAFATVGSIGTGQPPGAGCGADARPAGAPPTMLHGAAALMARGVGESVDGSPTAALSSLVRASDLLEPAGPGVLLPDSPAALAALVGLHCAELDTARAVLDRAVAARLGGAVMAARHRLLAAWILMVRGETGAARRYLPGNRDALQPRDRLFALALEVGLARRDSDLPALRQAWAVAGEAVLRHPVDLFTLLPLGELVVAAARLGDHTRTAGQLREAYALLARLGDPPLWTLPLRWSGLHAAIIGNQPALAEEHTAALAEHATHSRYAAAVSAAAGTWLALLAGRVDPPRVSSAARGLHDAGLRWDASRLAGQAAVRTSDRRAMVALLDTARLLQGRPAGQRGTDREPVPEASRSASLSEREWEVADLVTAGLTYRQIGGRLFISPKTVEHHVARIRQRLGCASRGELLATLRTLRRPTTPAAPSTPATSMAPTTLVGSGEDGGALR